MFQIIPEWVPNVHPLIVHFPIALLVVAVLLDLLRWIRPLSRLLTGPATLLYLLGVLGAAGAVWTGRAAADTVRVPLEAQTVLSDHDDRAIYTLIFFAAFAVLRTILYLIRLDRKGFARFALPVIGLVGVAFLWRTGELGKELVYKHGVGVAAVVFEDEEIDYTAESRWEDRDDGWLWHAGENAADVFRDRIELRGEGAGERLDFHTHEDEEGHYLEVAVGEGEGPLFLIVPGAVEDLSLEMGVNADEFEGRIGLVHHFHGAERYAFGDYDGNDIRLGRHEDGEDEVLDDGHHHAHGWFSLRVAADGRHFHAYADEEMVAHGHASPWEPGYVGILLDGSGELALRMLHLVKLRETDDHDHDNDNGHDHHNDHDLEVDAGHEDTEGHNHGHEHD